MKLSNSTIATIVIVAVLVIDQVLKILVKTHMMLGEEFCVLGDWFRIHFVENNGMAFGMEFAGEWGKIILTVFRIIAVSAIGYYLHKICKRTAEPVPTFYVVCIALVLAGAAGNIIDSVFYGVIFDSSIGNVATIFPEGGGYGTWLQGRVVDMFYFPLISGVYPTWFPFCGGEPFLFFRPVFNFADSAITVGIALLLIFHRETLNKDLSKDEQ